MSTTASVWNPDNIRDVSESIGLNALPPEVVDHLTRDVEFRIAQVLEEALKFMRHARRTTLHTQDVSQALRVLDVEPLYGYETTRALRFGEASVAPGQTLFYLEDEEVDFERLINAPLPKVPREVTFTAHWLAVEGVQPSIPQNPTPADTTARTDAGLSLLPKGTTQANALLAATAGQDNLTVKPLVKHILSKELQLYFEHVTTALLDETSSTQGPQGEDAYRLAALNSLRSDPGLHQLLPYFIQFVAEKVTHNLKSLFVLGQMLHLVAALLENPNLHLTPYVSSLVPPVLTCLIGKRLGPSAANAASANGAGIDGAPNGHAMTNGHAHPSSRAQLPAHYPLRRLASSILHALTAPKFTSSTPTLKPRLARTLLKHLLSPTTQPLGVYYGCILGLAGLAGAEGVRVMIVPNVREALGEILSDALGEGNDGGDAVEGEEMRKKEGRRREAQEVVTAVIGAFGLLVEDGVKEEGGMDVDTDTESMREKLVENLGDVLGNSVVDTGNLPLAKAVLEAGVGVPGLE